MVGIGRVEGDEEMTEPALLYVTVTTFCTFAGVLTGFYVARSGQRTGFELYRIYSDWKNDEGTKR